jgi:chromosomal replication initiation ATPase DnaA
MNHYVFSGLSGHSRWNKVAALNTEQAGVVEEHIMRALTHVLGVSESDIRSKRRYRVLVDARHMYCALMRRVSLLSLADIGRTLSRDHSTVIHALKSHANKVGSDAAYATAYAEVIDHINKAIELKNVKEED